MEKDDSRATRLAQPPPTAFPASKMSQGKGTGPSHIGRSGFVAVTRRVSKNRHPSRRRATSLHPELGKLCLVLPGGPNVGDQQPTARTQHPHRLADGFLPAGTSADVVDRQTGDNHIEAVVFKGQRRHVGRVQFDPIRHPLGDGVAPGGLGGIAGLIDASPQVHAHRPARGQVLGGHEQYRTPATSQVQDSLVTPKVSTGRAIRPRPRTCLAAWCRGRTRELPG